MKIKFTTKIIVPPSEKPVEVETSFVLETNMFGEEEEEKQVEPTYSNCVLVIRTEIVSTMSFSKLLPSILFGTIRG